jgi:hypothetical protein
MCSHSFRILGIAVLAALLAFGCGDDNGDTKGDGPVTTPDSAAPDGGTGGDASAPSASFSELEAYSAVIGTKEVKVEVKNADKVELLADGKVVATATAAPFTISWDTTKTSDGITKLTLKAYAGSASAESDELPVVVLNTGQEVTFDEGGDQTMNIVAGVDNHVKVHWTMPNDIKKVIGVVFWDNAEFNNMEGAVGTGWCPHSGTKAADATSTTSPVVVEYSDPNGSKLGTVQWFLHAGAVDETPLVGKSTKMTFVGYLLP